MDSIFNEELKEEELLSGFELLNTDDDSFLLDNGVEYPGKLPYKLSPNEIKDAEASEKLIKEFLEQQNNETSQTEEISGTVWNLFEEVDPRFHQTNQNDESNEDDDLKLGQTSDNDTQERQNSGIDSDDENTDINHYVSDLPGEESNPILDKFEETEDDFSDKALSNDHEETNESDTNRIETEEEVKFDEDFLSILQGDLNKSLLRKSGSETPLINQEEEDTDTNFKDFQPVDELEDTILIEFDSLGVKRPSEFNDDKNKVKSTPTKKFKPYKKKEEKKDKIKKEKVKIVLPALPWRKIAFSSATVAIFGGIFFLGYYLFFIDSETNEQINKIKNFKTKRIEKKTDTLKISQPEVNHVRENEIINDTLLLAQNDKTAERTANPELESNVYPHEIKKEKIIQKKIPSDISTINSHTSTRNQPNTNLKNITFINSDDKLYVIEVFSTPIKEEAEKWLLNLHNQKIFDGVIRTQKIRDEIWYKVRFGSFTSYEEAMKVVLKSGMKNARIDRIK